MNCLCCMWLCVLVRLVASLLFWIHVDCGTLSCSAITNELCRRRSAFAVTIQVRADDKSFPVMARTHGSVLCPCQACQNWWDWINQSARNRTVAWQWLTNNKQNVCQTAKQPSAYEHLQWYLWSESLNLSDVWTEAATAAAAADTQWYWVAALNLSDGGDPVDFSWVKRD